MGLFRLKRCVNGATSLWYYTVVPFFSQDGTQKWHTYEKVRSLLNGTLYAVCRKATENVRCMKREVVLWEKCFLVREMCMRRTVRRGMFSM